MTKRVRKVRLDPVIVEMRLSQIRELISHLGSIHSELHQHIGWSHCECELAQILRTYTNAIRNHLKLPKEEKAAMGGIVSPSPHCTPKETLNDHR